jgi:outer membrane protein TolC
MTHRKNIRPVAVYAGTFLLAFLTFILSVVPCAAQTVLSLDDCLALAEARHPDMASSAASVASSKGRLASTVAADRLDLSGSVSATRSGPERENTSYSAGVTASIKLYDANRNKYSVDASRSTLEAAGEDALETLAAVRANVKTAYLALLLAYETERQREESVSAFEQHLDQAKGFFDAGAKPWYDVTKAEVDLGNAQLSRVEASSSVRDARALLVNSMGIEQGEDFDIERSPLDIMTLAPGVLDSAEALAIENRPDLKSSALRLEAGRSSLKAEARAGSPTVSLTGGYTGAADDSVDFERGWNAGLRMSAPILDGGAAKARVDIAMAQADSLAASHEKLRQDILLSVSRARNGIEKAREGIRISRLTVAHAGDNLKLAAGRSETGVGDALEVTDAIVSYTDATLAESRARHELQTAIIDLEKAVGLDFGHGAENGGGKK